MRWFLAYNAPTMAHPFEKLFDLALRKSTKDDNLVLTKAAELIEKGYRLEEVCNVLVKLEKSLVDDREAGIVREAREEVCGSE
jgi:hypothetical protein